MGLALVYGSIAILAFSLGEAKKRIETLEFEVYQLKKLIEDRE